MYDSIKREDAMSQKSTNIIAIDTETTMRCDRDGFSSATHLDKKNEMLCIGFYGGALFHAFYGSSRDAYIDFFNKVRDISDVILVGHNIKFDLHYIANDYTDTRFFMEDWFSTPIWDTSIAHYILTGQTSHFPSLDETAKHWLVEDGEEKSDFLKELIASGKTTEDCPIEDLVEYMKQDCLVTYYIALAQMKYAREINMMAVVYTQCAALKAVWQMEHYGIYFDLLRSHSVQESIEEEQSHTLSEISYLLTPLFGDVGEHIENLITSNNFWSCVFFGGDYTLKTKEENGVWKSGARKGTPKYKTVETELRFPRHIIPTEVGSTSGSSGVFSVDAKVLTSIQAKGLGSPSLTTLGQVAKYLLQYRELEKILTTYVRSLPKKVWGTTIHPNINQTVTNTGRYSQSNPNLQNQSGDARVKELFAPRSGYAFVEADYKQLEVIAFAYVYRDAVLLQHLKEGVDIHERICLNLYGPSYTKEQRRTVKGVNFGTIYGGGSETIARQSGLDQSVVWEIQRAFFKTYTSIKPTRNLTMKSLTHSSNTSGFVTMVSSTGRTYSIPVDRKIIPSGVEYVPHYTKMCNYPIQGLATGDIVPMMLAYVEKWIRDKDLTGKIRMLNTIHDSILFEVDKDKVEEYSKLIKEKLEEAPQVFEDVFKKEFDLPLKVDVQYSTETWNGPWNKLADSK